LHRDQPGEIHLRQRGRVGPDVRLIPEAKTEYRIRRYRSTERF
jgi:hypothetical protein